MTFKKRDLQKQHESDAYCVTGGPKQEYVINKVDLSSTETLQGQNNINSNV